MGNFNEKLPKWQNPGTEPPASKQEEGWQSQERPPAGWLNWLFNRIYKAIEELQEKAVTRDEGDFAARQELEEHKENSSAHGIASKLQGAVATAKDYTDAEIGALSEDVTDLSNEYELHVGNIKRHIFQGDTPPPDAEEGSLWLDTSDNTYQGTVMEDYLETKQSFDSHLAEHTYLQEEEPTNVNPTTLWFAIGSEANFSGGGVAIENAETSVMPPETNIWFEPI